MKRTSAVLLASGALVAAVTGTALAGGSDDVPRSRGTSPASASATPSPGTSAASPTVTPSADGTATTLPAKGAVSSRRARAVALSHVGGGTVTKVEAETEHGRAVWSVRIVRDGVRYDVHVDTKAGEVTRSRGGAGDVRADSHRDDDGGARDGRSGADDHGTRAGTDHHRGDDGDGVDARSGGHDRGVRDGDGASDGRHGNGGEDGHGRYGRHHD
jgi:uncharacterized membrane protein YkoI